jgi:hypothetical protein
VMKSGTLPPHPTWVVSLPLSGASMRIGHLSVQDLVASGVSALPWNCSACVHMTLT